MTVVSSNPTPAKFVPPRRFDNGAEWLESLGDVPPERIIFDPWPGTATEEDLIQLIERDKRLCELIDGTLVEKPVGYLESYIASLLIMHLNNFVLPRRLGYVTGEAGMMRLAGGRVRLPDVAFVSVQRLPGKRVPRESIPEITPDLAVEVLSPNNTKAEIDQKLKEYFQSGTRLAWVIDPREILVEVYHRPDEVTKVLDLGGILDGEDVLPGFELIIAELFEPIIDPPRDR